MIARLLLLPLMLAACSQQPPVAANDEAPAMTDAPAVEQDAIEDAPIASATAVAKDATPPAASNEAMPPFAEVPNAHPTAPEPAPIPARFRGTYARDAAACADLKDPSRLTVSGRTVRMPGKVIFGDRFETPDANSVAVSGKIEGTDTPANTRLTLDGTVLRQAGAADRVRCA